jgi:hypothetical protein
MPSASAFLTQRAELAVEHQYHVIAHDETSEAVVQLLAGVGTRRHNILFRPPPKWPVVGKWISPTAWLRQEITRWCAHALSPASPLAEKAEELGRGDPVVVAAWRIVLLAGGSSVLRVTESAREVTDAVVFFGVSELANLVQPGRAVQPEEIELTPAEMEGIAQLAGKHLFALPRLLPPDFRAILAAGERAREIALHGPRIGIGPLRTLRYPLTAAAWDWLIRLYELRLVEGMKDDPVAARIAELCGPVHDHAALVRVVSELHTQFGPDAAEVVDFITSYGPAREGFCAAVRSGDRDIIRRIAIWVTELLLSLGVWEETGP